ncbi:uncharacterized protein LOC142509967 [Primulina tabacum]|uniref:uncharacterized protein LOC142509967 n=1 Tax=Primulina tabacum TaxID=48773 RepID=UPI003F593425
MTIVTIVATTLQGLVTPNANQQPPPPPQGGIKIHYESLRKNRCPTFQEDVDPKLSQNWLKSVETHIGLLEIPDALRVDVIVSFHEGKASKWWEAVSPAMTAVRPITWQRFRDVFLKQYFPVETFKKPNQFGGPSKGPSPTTSYQAIKPCPICNFRHMRECRRASSVCLGCGKPGHRMAECPDATNRTTGLSKGDGSNSGVNTNKPRENKPNARVFAMTQEEANDANDFVSGTMFIQQVPAYVLFDCGATHSFISKRFAKKLGHKPEKLSEPFFIATPTAKAIETCEIRKDCRININNRTFSADLIQLIMVDFDIILGMDWLARNNAMVDCKGKSVRLRTPYQKEVLHHGKSKERKTSFRIPNIESHEI